MLTFRLFTATLLLQCARLATAGTLQFDAISVPGYTTLPNAINDLGTVVGSTGQAAFRLTSDGAFTAFSPGGGYAQAMGINNAGVITGVSASTAAAAAAFWGVLGGPYATVGNAYASGINNPGQVLVYSYAGESSVRQADHSPLALTFQSSWYDPEPWGINDLGAITGTYYDSGRHGFLRSPEGEYTTLDYPGAIDTRAGGIDNAGDIVGYYKAADGQVHAFIRSASGDYASLDYPGATSTRAFGINNNGAIVGDYYADGEWHGFIATQQAPEPSPAILTAVGLALCARRFRRRKRC